MCCPFLCTVVGKKRCQQFLFMDCILCNRNVCKSFGRGELSVRRGRFSGGRWRRPGTRLPLPGSCRGAEARRPLGFVVGTRASLDVAVTKPEPGPRRESRVQGASRPQSLWTQVWLLGVHAQLCEGEGRLHSQGFSHGFYWLNRSILSSLWAHVFFEKHLHGFLFFSVGVWHLHCLCF